MKRLALLLLLPAACAAGTPTDPVTARAVRRPDESSLMVWSFEFTNRTQGVILLLEVRAGYGGKLESIGGFDKIAHASEEGKSTLSPGETLHFVRRESNRPDDVEVLIVYRREGLQERLEARARARLAE